MTPTHNLDRRPRTALRPRQIRSSQVDLPTVTMESASDKSIGVQAEKFKNIPRINM